MIKIYLTFLLYLASANDKPQDVIIRTELGDVILNNNKRKAYMITNENPDLYAENIMNVLSVMHKKSTYVWLYRVEVHTPDSVYKYKRPPFKRPHGKIETNQTKSLVLQGTQASVR